MTTSLKDDVDPEDFGIGAQDAGKARHYAAFLVAAERECCAKLCEEVHADTSECPELALHCAARIRGA